MPDAQTGRAVKKTGAFRTLITLAALLLIATILWPRIDLIVAGWSIAQARDFISPMSRCWSSYMAWLFTARAYWASCWYWQPSSRRRVTNP